MPTLGPRENRPRWSRSIIMSATVRSKQNGALTGGLPLRLVGQDVQVPLVTGQTIHYVNLDYAASTPPLEGVKAAVDGFLPWYSSVHRGAGFKSQVSTRVYEQARETVGQFFGARHDDAVVFTRNTTDSMNLLASALPDGTTVVMFPFEHHANMLPWRTRGFDVVYADVPDAYGMVGESLAATLQRVRDRGGESILVAISGASNVTGELLPLTETVQVAHAFGARLVVDAAQLAPHRAIDLAGIDADYMAMSGHKMYAPYGAGVLIGRRDWLDEHVPYLAGGGAVDLVTRDRVWWTSLPDRQEAGTPNVVGAVALAEACRELGAVGVEELASHEASLFARLEVGLAGLTGIERYSIWPDGAPSLGISSFNMKGYEHSYLAAILSCEYGIGVRHGCFCAHPLIMHVLGVEESVANDIASRMQAGDRRQVPGAVRVSFGVGVTESDVDSLIEALHTISDRGPQWEYRSDPVTGDYEPLRDPRPWPLGMHEPSHRHQLGESS